MTDPVTVTLDAHARGGAAPEPNGGGGGGCACGGTDETGSIELDARTIPHAVRHGAVFGALDAIPAGGCLVLLAPHDPRALLAQMQRRTPDAFDVEYLESGPETWRLGLTRRHA